MKKQKLFLKILSGSKNINFHEFVGLVKAFGFSLSRISGSHHIFVHRRISELINLQNVKGQIRPYQVKQFLELVERYDLKMEDSE